MIGTPTSIESPAPPPTPTEADYTRLRANFDEARRNMGPTYKQPMSAAELERAAGWPTAQLTKLLKGDRPLRHEQLIQAGTVLRCEPAALVAGTVWKQLLLETPPESPNTKELADLSAKLEEVTARLGASEAAREEERTQKAAAFVKLAALERQVREAQAARLSAEGARTAMAAEVAAVAHSFEASEKDRWRLLREIEAQTARIVGLEAELSKVQASSREWITKAKVLEGQVKQLQALLAASGTLNFLQLLGSSKE